jgi:hypothetical protein
MTSQATNQDYRGIAAGTGSRATYLLLSGLSQIEGISMRKTLAVIGLAFVLLFAGCLQQPASPGAGAVPSSGTGRANFQRCVSQCGTGNAGNGTLCMDGCRVQEAADTKSTSLCDSLVDQANRPSCYGTVAKAAGDRSICDRFSNATEKAYCVSVFGGPGTS